MLFFGSLFKGSKTYGISEDELLRIAAIGESYSEHPLARAIINEAEARLETFREAPENVQIITGQGLRFKTGGKYYIIGNRRLWIWALQ